MCWQSALANLCEINSSGTRVFSRSSAVPGGDYARLYRRVGLRTNPARPHRALEKRPLCPLAIVCARSEDNIPMKLHRPAPATAAS